MDPVPGTVPLSALLAHREFVRGLARSLVVDDARADDVAQQVWLDAMRRPPPEDRGIGGWLARVVRRRSRDARRSERRHADAIARAAEERTAPAADAVVAHAEVARRLVEEVMALDEPFRTAILLRFYEGLPPREVAARTGVGVETARARVRRGLVRLRERFGAQDRTRGDAWLGALALLAGDPRGGPLARDRADPGTSRSSQGGASHGAAPERRAPRAARPARAPRLLRFAGVAATVAAGAGLVVAALGFWAIGDDGASDGANAGERPGTSSERRGAARARRPAAPRAQRPSESESVSAAGRSLAVPLPLAAPAPPPPPAEDDVAGTWDLVLTRKGWQPEATTGRLVLERDGRTWKGSLAFDVVLHARRYDLEDVGVSASRKLRFSIDEPGAVLRFTGEGSAGALSGTCKWTDCGEFPWTATRADGAVLRFEPGLSFDADLPQGEAEKLGLDGSVLDELIRAAAKDDTDALVVVKDGKVVAERTFGRPAGEIHLMSVTKAITALALVREIEDGRIRSLDEPVSAFLPGWDEGDRAQVTLRHLVSHTSGIRHGKTAKELNEARDKVAYVTSLPVDHAPGTRHEYNNEAVALLGGIVRRSVGWPLDQVVKERILEPCGVSHFSWDRDEAGNALAYANLAMTARDLARVGVMLANEGKGLGAGRALAPASVKRLAAPTTSLRKDQALLWMLSGEEKSKSGQALFHTGWLGQWFVVHPKSNLVAVRLRRWKDDDGAARREYEAGGFGSRVAALVR